MPDFRKSDIIVGEVEAEALGDRRKHSLFLIVDAAVIRDIEGRQKYRFGHVVIGRDLLDFGIET